MPILGIQAIWVLLACVVVQDIPEALRNFEKARREIKSGSFHFSVFDPTLMNSPFEYKCRIAKNGDRMLEELGDAEGWTRYAQEPASGALIPKSRLAMQFLNNAEGCWSRISTTSNVRLWRNPTSPGNPLAEQLKDIRWLGMAVSGRELLQRPAAVWGGGGVSAGAATVKWASTVVDGKHLVRADYGRNERVEWSIDPARGWNAERITRLIRTGDTDQFSATAESVISLEKISGQWFPRAIRQYERGELFREIDVLDASINGPNDPQALTAPDIGVEPGFSIAPQDFSAGSPRGLRWSSKGLVEAVRWDELERGGERPGPTLQRELRGEMSPAYTEDERTFLVRARAERAKVHAQAGRRSLWEQYVDEFIRTNTLSDEQAQKARLILAECQGKADQFLLSRKTELENILKSLDEIKSPDPKSVDIKKLELDRLTAPLDTIFEEELTPRLDRLLTKEQRDRGSSRAASTQATKAKEPK